MNAERIGLLGGSFDPPHLGHHALASVAMEALRLHELRWLPAGAPWQKAGRELAPIEHRVAMLRLLMADHPGFTLDERELHRTGPTYSIDTVRELRAEHPHAEFWLIIGQDQYARFDTWRDWPELLAQVGLAVAAREGVAVQAPPAVAAHTHRVLNLALPRLDISASEIRARCAQSDKIAALVGAPIARYIDQHALYRGRSRS